ncbi:MAG: hypothetical protein CL607_28295 [Anaerolineaceae bacterium]|nr:hypothetical protein [Anaerolineaceae bacterium]
MSETWDAHRVANELLESIPRLNRAIFLFTHSLEDDDITIRQIFTLDALRENPMTASEIARRRNVSLQSVSSLTQGLVERGLLTRVRKPDDRRQYLLQVTDAGVELTERIKSEVVDHAASLISGMTDEELAAASVFLPALQRQTALSPPPSDASCP